MDNPSSGYNSGKLRARTGTEGSSRGMPTPVSLSYARSEGGRGEGSRSIGIPSPYAGNESQGSGFVAYPHTTSRRRHGTFSQEASAPHTAYSTSERRDEGSSRDYTRSANGRDFDAPPSVRMPARADAHTLRSDRRHSVNEAASFNGRIPTARSDPPPTRRGQNMPRSTTSMRPTRTASHTGGNPITSASSTNFPKQSISKRVRFTRSVAGSSPSLSHVSQALPSPSRTSTTPLSPSYPSLAPLSPPHPSRTSHSRSPSSVAPHSPSKEEADIHKGMLNPVEAVMPRPRPNLVAMVLRAIRRLFAKRISIQKGLWSIRLHPLLRVQPDSRPARLTWDVRRSPLLRDSTLTGVQGLKSPATTPPTKSMQLVVVVSGLTNVQWTTTVLPFDSREGDVGSAVVRCIDVLHALHRLLRRRVKEQEYEALDKARQDRVSRVFWARCAPTRGEGDSANTEANFGVRRIDLLDGWEWRGLTAGTIQGEWIAILGKSSGLY